MGKVKDEAPAKAAKPTAKGSATKDTKRRRLAPFLANLFRTQAYKPTQGWYARLWTGIGLAAIVVVGLYRLSDVLKGSFDKVSSYGITAAVGVVLGWILFRILQYPPFADFLIATEAEMNKVSWTSKEDLVRATSVVLTTVVLLSVFLLVVDWVWSSLLTALKVLHFDGGGGFGSSG